MGLNINEIKQTHHHHIKMGRGRKSIFVQGNSKKKKECGPLPMEERRNLFVGLRPVNQTIVVDIPEDVLNELRQLNPRDVANILVN